MEVANPLKSDILRLHVISEHTVCVSWKESTRIHFLTPFMSLELVHVSLCLCSCVKACGA